MPTKERRWRTPGKKGQLRSSLHVNRPRAKIKISVRRRTKAIPTLMRSNHSTGAKAPGKARVHKDWEQQEPDRDLETNRGAYLNAIVRQPDQVTVENMETNRRPEIKGTGEP